MGTLTRGIVALLAGAVLGAAAPAHASERQETLFQDDDLLLHDGPGTADRTLDELRNLGVDRVRVSVIWRDLAPERNSVHRPAGLSAEPGSWPAERFDALDHLVRAARHRGIEVLLNVRGGAPRWALGRAPKRLAERDAYKPSPAHFREFVAMVGHRYSGQYADENQGGHRLPRVTAWSIWNEPNWGGLLQPQSDRDPGTRRLTTVAPRHYRRLYRAAVQALSATTHGADTILLGETAPIGNARLGELSHLEPVTFLRHLFCLDRNLRPMDARLAARMQCDFDKRGPLHATGYAHHPYSVMQAPDVPSQDTDWITFADSGRLKAILDAAAAAGRIPAELPLWYTEFGYQTSPPDPVRGVTLEQQAEWLGTAEYMTWSDARIAGWAQFLLRDDEPRTQYAADDPRHWGTYQTGLEFQDGTPKPAYFTYRMPLRASGGNGSEPLTLWGMVRPGANGVEQRIRVQFRASENEAWRTLSDRLVTDPRGYFTETIPGPQTGWYRFEWLAPFALLSQEDPGTGGASAPLFVAVQR